jgi:chromosome segregation ATPase
MSHLTGLTQIAKTTLDDRKVFVVDLSTELVEKHLQIEQMGTRTRELEEQVEVWDDTIEVLENQLHDLQVELDETNDVISWPSGW